MSVDASIANLLRSVSRSHVCPCTNTNINDGNHCKYATIAKQDALSPSIESMSVLASINQLVFANVKD